MDCIICRKPFTSGDVARNLTAKGFQTLLLCSEEKCDSVVTGIYIDGMRCHVKCQKDYTRKSKGDKRCLESGDKISVTVTLRGSENVFDFKSHCLFCGNAVMTPRELTVKKLKGKGSVEFSVVTTLEIKDTILKQCRKRNDSRSEVVLRRIGSSIDLVAEEARYHHGCFTNFLKNDSYNSVSGRPSDNASNVAFNKVCDYLNSNSFENCQFSLKHLFHIFNSTFDNENQFAEHAWSFKYFKSKLNEKFGDSIAMTNFTNSENFLCFKGTTKQLIMNCVNQNVTDEKQAKENVLKCAAEILKEDIFSKVHDLENFPSNDDIKSGGEESLSPMLIEFLKNLCTNATHPNTSPSQMKKILALANAITFLSRPRSFVPPVLLSLSVYLHRKYQSRELCNVINNLGFGMSYNEVLKYENSAVNCTSISVDNDAFIQFVGDNADIPVRTLDGTGTFHTMGSIMCVTSRSAVSVNNSKLSRQSIPGLLKEHGFNPIFKFHRQRCGLKNIILSDISVEESDPACVRQLLSNEMLRLSKKIFSSGIDISSWQGHMSLITKEKKDFTTSDIVILPFINLNPTNLDTIYSCLSSASSLARKYDQTATIVTLDQPLYIKAVDIINSSDSDNLFNVIVRLGGFHLIMSFMGSIGYIMSGSGLEDLWENIYAKNSIPQMLAGHAYARALRAHFITQQSLSVMILRDILVSENDRSMFENLNGSNICSESGEVKDIVDRFKHELTSYSEKNRTAKLWCQYWELVQLLKSYIAAERTGNWNMHLYSIRNMIPFFHATGHYHYAKCAHLYLQDMIKIESQLSHSQYKLFTSNGYFTIRRTEKFWSGTWTDMVIEQDLMRVLKVQGGLTQRSGLTNDSVARWISAMPCTSKLITSFEEFTGVKTLTSEQHVELRESRIKRDNTDTEKVVKWLTIHSPFTVQSTSVVSISNGLAGGDSCNCDNSLEEGKKGFNKVIGKPFSEAKCSSKIVNITSSMNVKTKSECSISFLDPMQLFTRTMAVIKTQEDIKLSFHYEFSLYPPSIFTGPLLRKSAKSELVTVFDNLLKPTSQLPLIVKETSTFYIDGGLLLHRLQWKTPLSYQTLFTQYLRYVKKHFGENVVIVFDGYHKLSTKSMEQARRGTARSIEIEISLSDEIQLTQNEFLYCSKNKQKLITSLISFFETHEVKCIQAESDADLRLVQATLLEENSVLVSEDTDIIVLLLHYNKSPNIWLLRPGRNGSADRYTNVHDLQKIVGKEACSGILAFHAITGCDTLSGLFKKGKKSCFKIFSNKSYFAPDINCFYEICDRSIVSEAGKSIIKTIYGGKTTTLNDMRYELYRKKIARMSATSDFHLACLPPTDASCEMHVLRAYLQVQSWLGKEMDPEKWGWYNSERDQSYLPLTGIHDPTLPSLTKSVYCNCKTNCGPLCSCRRNNMACTMQCGECIGVSCENSESCVNLKEDEDEGDF